jgi:2-dehydropantoate 2-reductase
MTDTPILAFVGAGSLGQSFAGLMAQSGQAVTLLATSRTAAQLFAAGTIRLRGVVTVDSPVMPAPAPAGIVGITDDPAVLPAGCGLIFLTKAHHLPEAIATVRAAWPNPDDGVAWVTGFQNGVQKEDLLADAFGAARVVGGATILGAQRKEDHVVVTSLGGTYLGELAGGGSPRVTAAVDALMHAGIPAEAVADIRSVLWSKACNAAGVFGVSVLARATTTQMSHDRDLMRAYLALVRETAATATAYGVRVGNYPNFPPIRTYAESPEEEALAAMPNVGTPPPPGGSLPSMTQDLLAGRPMEVEGVFGDLVTRAERAAVPVPYLTFARDVLRGLNRITTAQ